MILLALTAVGIALGYLLWRFWWPTCFTSTCFSTTSLSYGCGAAWDGNSGSAVLLVYYGVFVLGCMYALDRSARSATKELTPP